jgi:non-ribosomal peptide synthetase component F
MLGRNLGLGQLFYDQVQQTPESIAVIDGHSSLTYSQLHSQALFLAKQLSQEFLSIEEPVGIVVQHGIGDVVAQLAIIYAGGSCAPMDPTLPNEQIQRRLSLLKARYILVDQVNKYRALPFRQFVVDCSGVLAKESGPYPIATDLEHRTHLIHTSGTTNEPKAVQIAARSILQVVLHAPFEPLNASDVVAHVNNSSFDVSLFDIWAPLLCGARIAVLGKAVLLDLPVMAEHIDRLGITVMATTTALLNLASSTYPKAFAKLRICFIGGEAANVSAIETIFNKGPPEMLINA